VDIRIDLAPEPPSVVLAEPEDCERFQVTVSGGADRSAVAGALAESGLGRLDDDASGAHAWIFVSAVRLAAAGRVGPDWPAAFEAMLAYASSKGWLSAGGEEIRAHVEWPV
jgi:hypothetical protein